ncbi:Endoribonuclease MazF9 [Chlamydiales bacterium SCGC AB-751-O23]|jgi:mRNA interferase MazF|nr:Endoribonuclease MazF9 [Chlamydiales bacterium SCGC AB-751-O23]
MTNIMPTSNEKEITVYTESTEKGAQVPFYKPQIKASFPKRGEVYWVYLDSRSGSELGKSRPAIVVSTNFCNKNLGRVTVMPITSSKAGPNDTIYDNEVRTVIPNNRGFDVRGKALADQLTTIDHGRLSTKICTLNKDTMKKVQESLKKFLEIDA